VPHLFCFWGVIVIAFLAYAFGIAIGALTVWDTCRGTARKGASMTHPDMAGDAIQECVTSLAAEFAAGGQAALSRMSLCDLLLLRASLQRDIAQIDSMVEAWNRHLGR
jgi:hypothetical protein